MKPNSITQSDGNLDFNGMKGDGVNRGSNKFAGNQHSGIQNPNKLFNNARGPLVGNKSTKATPGTDSMPGHAPGKDMFTSHAQVRTPGGTRAFDPAMGQNYTGNADKINVGRGPTKGNQL